MLPVLFCFNPFFPTVPACAVQETASLGIIGIPRVPPLKPLRVDSALRALSTLRGLSGGTRGAPIMPRDAVSRTANVERTVRH